MADCIDRVTEEAFISFRKYQQANPETKVDFKSFAVGWFIGVIQAVQTQKEPTP